MPSITPPFGQTGGAGTVSAQTVRISIQKTYNDQPVPLVNPLTSATQVDTTTTGATG